MAEPAEINDARNALNNIPESSHNIPEARIPVVLEMPEMQAIRTALGLAGLALVPGQDLLRGKMFYIAPQEGVKPGDGKVNYVLRGLREKYEKHGFTFELFNADS